MNNIGEFINNRGRITTWTQVSNQIFTAKSDTSKLELPDKIMIDLDIVRRIHFGIKLFNDNKF